MLLSQKRENDDSSNHFFEMSKKMRMKCCSLETEYVDMPWDDKNQIIIQKDGIEKAYSRWDLVQECLQTTKISSIEDFVSVIKSYNIIFEMNGSQSTPNWKCLTLNRYLESLDEFHRNQFFKDNGVLCCIKNLVLQLKDLVPKLKLLKSGSPSVVRLHQMQIASILANAFFCTFPKGNKNCPSINFDLLYENNYGSVPSNCLEKLKCIVHYFERIHKKKPTGSLSFHRLCIPDNKFPRWDKTTMPLCSLQVDNEGKIEDQNGFLQMDFANKFIGGGVLGKGCVQEEIRFVICPELIASRLFTECLADNESMLIIGAERYCKYTGYSNTFKFGGDFQDCTPLDENGQRKTYIIVLDALYFHECSEQYRESRILRELKKAYVGFKAINGVSTLPIATGNWGCGAFKGDPQLKSILQLMASSQACRDVLYLTFGNSILRNQIQDFYQFLIKEAVDIGVLYRTLRLYNRRKRRNQTVFEFVKELLGRNEKRKLYLKPNTPGHLNLISAPEETIQSLYKIQNDKFSTSLDFDASDEYLKNQLHQTTSSKHKHFLPIKTNNVECTRVFNVLWYENEANSTNNTKFKDEKIKICSGLFSNYKMEIVKTDKVNYFLPTNETKILEKIVNDPQKIIRQNTLLNQHVGTRETKKSDTEKFAKKYLQPKITDLFKK